MRDHFHHGARGALIGTLEHDELLHQIIGVLAGKARIFVVSLGMSQTTESPPSFEAALAELEALVGRMESGELPLAESLAAYKRGAQLLAYCQGALKDAQQQVQVLEKGVLQPFSPDEADDA